MSNISLLLPVKNGAKYLPSSIANIRGMVGPDDEILVVNDYSTDSTVRMIQEFSQSDSRIKLINNREPGLVGALNLGLKESSNTWVARCDVDDRYHSNRIKIQSGKITKDSAAIFSDYSFFSDSVENLGRIPSAIFNQAVSVSLALSQRTAHPSVLLNKIAVEEAGGYIPEDFPAEDLSLWLRLSRIGKLTSVEDNLLLYRLDINSISFQKRREIMVKKKNLFLKIGINSEDYSFVLENISEILKGYEGMELGNQRKMLLIREILTILRSPANFGLKSVKVNPKKMRIISELFSTQSLKDVYELNAFKKKRAKIRETK